MKIPATITQDWLRKRTDKELVVLAKKWPILTARGLLTRQERDSRSEQIHYLNHMTFAAVWTACGEGMQTEGNKWHKDVNLWGEEGIQKTNGFVLAATDKDHVTCPKCLKKLKRRNKK